MKNMIQQKLIAVGALCLASGITHATTTQFRSPLMLDRGPIHYQLPYVPHVWWFDDVPADRQDGCMEKWFVNNWTGLYGRTATKSFYKAPCDTDDACKSNSVTRSTASLSQLFFGAEAFRGADIFANSAIPTGDGNQNVYLGFSRITPRFQYTEYGVMLGLQAERTVGCNNSWYVGGRASMPVEVIDVLFDQSNGQLFETIQDVVRTQQISNGTGGANAALTDFAVRLDFLNSLSVPTGGTLAEPTWIPYVVFGDGSTSVETGNTQMFAGNEVAQPTATNACEIAVVGSTTGLPISYTYRKDLTAAGVVALPTDGALANNGVAYFKTGQDYNAALGASLATQGTLYVVPTITDGNPLELQSTTLWNQLSITLRDLTIGSAQTPVAFFAQHNTPLAQSQRVTGQGDLQTEIYGGYRPNDFFYTDLFVGVRFPTGKQQKDAQKIYYQTTGHNGHFEFKVGMDLALRACKYVGFKTDWSFNHAFNHKEHRNAAFAGATARNIGPQVDATVNWNYWIVHFDLNFFHPHNPEIGGVFGYEFFAKQNDNVSFCQKTAVDYLGQTKPLDATILEKNTNPMTHKLRGEVYHRWNYCELSLGASQILAGRNAMKESEAYIGITLHF